MSVAYQCATVYYGPFKSFYTYCHSKTKLRGIIDGVMKLGFRVKTVKVKDINLCVIIMCGYEVFRCNITQLGTAIPAFQDPVATAAITAIQAASAHLEHTATYFWLYNLIQTEMFQRNKYSLNPDFIEICIGQRSSETELDNTTWVPKQSTYAASHINIVKKGILPDIKDKAESFNNSENSVTLSGVSVDKMSNLPFSKDALL